MSNSIRSLKLTGFLLVTVLGISSAHAIQLINVEPVLGTFFVRHCLTVKGGSTANGTPLQGDRCESIFGQDATFAHQDATFAQEWNWEFFGIQGIGTDALGSRCIDVAGGGTADRTPVQLFACNGTGAQKWIFRNGQIINPQSGKCLDVDVFDDDPGPTQARIFTCSNIRIHGQLWMIR
jgi:hypothetical protein